jgi:type II secretory pathway predicted ATPase ExeA
VAGRNAPLIDDNAFELLYEKSQGIPREIIRLCALATDYLVQSDETMINLDIVREVIHE